MKECEVRKFVKRNFGNDRLIWLEHNFGGTVGAPDVFIFTDGWIPVELKVGSIVGDDLVFFMRPTQIAFYNRLKTATERVRVLVGCLGKVRVVNAKIDPFLSDLEHIGKSKRIRISVPMDQTVEFHGKLNFDDGVRLFAALG